MQEQSTLSDELSQTLYYESQGITDLAIKLYFLAQRYAIITKEECLTRETIQATAKLGLHSVQRFLQDIRDNNTKRLKTYNDQSLSSDIERNFQLAESELTKRVKTNHSFITKNTESTKQALAIKPDDPQRTLQNIATQTVTQLKTEETLPQITAQGLKKFKISPYEALKQAGYIFHTAEHLTEEKQL